VKLVTHLHLVPRSKKEWSYTSIPLYASVAWCSVKAQGQLYLLTSPLTDGSFVRKPLKHGVTRIVALRLEKDQSMFSLSLAAQHEQV
jgi:hypothetical protein